jgi:ribosomal protein S12 methylthiotransferase
MSNASRTQPSAAVVTLGCPMNEVDSENIMSGLVRRGFELTVPEEAEVLVVNTCAFVADAREESLEAIMSLAELKETGRLQGLVVAGCLAERYRADLEAELDEADAVLGLTDRERIPDVCLDLLKRVAEDGGYTRTVTGPPNTAYLKIAEGCDNRCTFCAIPGIRGMFRSRPADQIVAEAVELAELGNRELVLIAQDSTAWGLDLPEPDCLTSLLARLNGIEDVRWLRLMYAHPASMDDGLIEAIASLDHVVPYVDMPVQHIAAGVLKRMGRTTSPDRIREIVARLRDRIPDVAIRTAVLTGFPGETEADFRELLDFVEEARFDRLGAFVYSPEEGTAAARLKETVPTETARERYEAVLTAQETIAGYSHAALVGGIEEVIIDEYDTEAGIVHGRTYRDAPEVDGIVVAHGTVPHGQAFCSVRVTDSDVYALEGDIVQE